MGGRIVNAAEALKFGKHKSHQKHCCHTDETPLKVVFREANLWGQIPFCAAKFACKKL